MRTIYIILLVIFSLNVAAQNSKRYQYNSECNYWIAETFNEPVNNIMPDIYTWNYVQTPVTAQITEIFFIDLLNGWASHTEMGVLKTTDSGFNWTKYSFNDTTFTTAFNGIHFINTMTGWAVGGALQIRKTTNGGLNWNRQIPPPVAGQLLSVYFMDEKTGYAAGSKSYPFLPFICKTTNGGTNWVEISPNFATPGAQELNDQYWFNASTGWIAGYDVLLYTTNGGANYANLYANIPPTSNGANELLSITFVNQKTGWIGGSNIDSKNIYKTTNGGDNWFFQPNPVSTYPYPQINDVKFKSKDTGWAIHGTPVSGAIMITTNAGTNWIIEDGTNIWFDCISIYQSVKAWVGSGSGLVWYANLLTTFSGGTTTNNFTRWGLPVAINEIGTEIPKEYFLSQNYPNPFNPQTKIRFNIPPSDAVSGRIVKLEVYDILGREAAILVNEQLNPGIYEVDWNSSNHPSGVYYYKLTAGAYSDTKKMILIK